MVIGAGLGSILASRLIAELNAHAVEAEVIGIGEDASPEDIAKLQAAADAEGRNVRIVAGAPGVGKSFGLGAIELKSYAIAEPELYVLPRQGGGELKHLRKQSQHQLSRKQQSLQAKARRR
jgi:hypothetical protein